jgi:hypothetical protein
MPAATATEVYIIFRLFVALCRIKMPCAPMVVLVPKASMHASAQWEMLSHESVRSARKLAARSRINFLTVMARIDEPQLH